MEELIAWAESLGLRPVVGIDGSVLHLSDAEAEFSIVEYHTLNVVEAASAGDRPIVLGAFEDIEDASRLLAMLLGGLLRFREGLPKLEARRLPPGFVIEEAPTGLWLTWFTGTAEFPRGDRSRSRAMNFSRVERAETEQIRLSFTDPSGHPLYQAA